jgi:hypothetical protein
MEALAMVKGNLAGWSGPPAPAAQSTSGGKGKGGATSLAFTTAEEQVVRLAVFQGRSWKEVGSERIRSTSTNRTLLKRALEKADLEETSYQELRGNAADLGFRMLEALFPEHSVLQLLQLIAEPPSTVEELLQLAATQPPTE